MPIGFGLIGRTSYHLHIYVCRPDDNDLHKAFFPALFLSSFFSFLLSYSIASPLSHYFCSHHFSTSFFYSRFRFLLSRLRFCRCRRHIFLIIMYSSFSVLYPFLSSFPNLYHMTPLFSFFPFRSFASHFLLIFRSCFYRPFFTFIFFTASSPLLLFSYFFLRILLLHESSFRTSPSLSIFFFPFPFSYSTFLSSSCTFFPFSPLSLFLFLLFLSYIRSSHITSYAGAMYYYDF